MKKILFILVGSLYIFLGSCKKTADGPGEIYGNWKLTETLADIGDGSGKYIKVKENKYLEFFKSGVVTGDAAPDFSRFKIIDSVKIEFSSKSSKQTYIYRYKVSSQSLTLNPPCFEGCGLRFKKE